MKKKVLFAVSILMLCIPVFSEIPKNLLEKSDKAYIPSKSNFHILIENYEADEKNQYYDMDCYLKGNAKYLVFFKGPAIMKGQGQLRLGDVIYQYVRKIDKLTPVSARVNFYQSVLSQEDVMSSMLSNFYEVTKTEVVENNGKKLFRMNLQAKAKRSTYASIIADIDAVTLLPVHRCFYSYSGQLVKEMIWEEIKKNNKKLSYVRFRVLDMLRPKFYSIITMDSFALEPDINDKKFTIAYLKANVK